MIKTNSINDKKYNGIAIIYGDKTNILSRYNGNKMQKINIKINEEYIISESIIIPILLKFYFDIQRFPNIKFSMQHINRGE